MKSGYTLKDTPTQIIWDGDQIFIATKKNYMILNYRDGVMTANLALVNQDIPMMSVYKDKCLVVSKLGKEAQYLEPGGTLKDQPYFDLESSIPLVSIQLVDNEYVVAVFETFIKVFKASNGKELQKLGFLDKRAQ